MNLEEREKPGQIIRIDQISKLRSDEFTDFMKGGMQVDVHVTSQGIRMVNNQTGESLIVTFVNENSDDLANQLRNIIKFLDDSFGSSKEGLTIMKLQLNKLINQIHDRSNVISTLDRQRQDSRKEAAETINIEYGKGVSRLNVVGRIIKPDALSKLKKRILVKIGKEYARKIELRLVKVKKDGKRSEFVEVKINATNENLTLEQLLKPEELEELKFSLFKKISEFTASYIPW